MNKLSLLLCAALLGATGGCTIKTGSDADRPRHEDKSDWRKLGDREVDGKSDKDHLELAGNAGKVRQIRLKVHHGALDMHDVVVVFEDDSKFSPDTRKRFEAGVTSNVIDLPGGKRNIKRITFKYTDVKDGTKALVEVWGR